MTRGQRAIHLRVFSLLPLLLLAALTFALAQRRAAERHLRQQAERPTVLSSSRESAP